MGTTVTLYLPQLAGEGNAQRSAMPPAPAEEPAGEAIPAGLRVMLVEDDAEVRQVVRTFLRMLGCRVETAANGEEALSALQAEAAPFELLVSDIALGAGMRGTRLAAEAQQRHPRLMVLLMSGFSSELLDADREVPPSWELLPKPCSRAELAGAIARLLAARAPG
jgi:DNA-binding NtrC family response regulator